MWRPKRKKGVARGNEEARKGKKIRWTGDIWRPERKKKRRGVQVVSRKEERARLWRPRKDKS